mgnify:CR=1 FL=1
MNLKNYLTIVDGDRVYLKTMNKENATQDYCDWLNDPEVNKYLETRKATTRDLRDYIKSKLESDNCIFFGIFFKENNKHIGTVKLEPIEWEKKEATFGIMIGDKNYWRMGLGAEATKLTIKFAFEQLFLNEIDLGVISENKPAIRAYKKAGFKVTGIKKKAINHDGKLFDDIIMIIKNTSKPRGLKKLKRCSRCLLTETHETIFFDEAGVCNVCRQIEYKDKKIDWRAKKNELDEIIKQYKDKGSYDCIVPFSGGKDSTWTLYYLVKKYGLKPLAVQFDHGFMRPNLCENNIRTFKKLGVDYISFRPNWQIVKKVKLESLKRKGDFCWHCHAGIFAYPMQIAVKFNIPLVIWGEPSAEYTSYYSYDQAEEVNEKRFNRFVNLGITAEDMAGMVEGITLRDLEPFRYPSLKSLRDIGYKSICLGSYIPWDVKKQVTIIKKELGWKEDKVEGIPSQYNYEKIECAMQGVRDYLKFIKRGFSRVTHLASIDIRNNRLKREDGLRLIKKYEGKRPASLDIFLKYLDITEKEFNDISISHLVSPNEPAIKRIRKGKELPDQKVWNKD